MDFDGIYLHREPVDMRKGINGLCDLVSIREMGAFTSKNLFIFCGRRKDSIKILYFDRSGYALWQKRLDQDKFSWPKKVETSIVVMTNEQLQWLLEGYDVWKMRPFAELQFANVC